MENTKLIIGNPVKPMLVKDLGNSEKRYNQIIRLHDGQTYSEVKSDGYRIQIHRNNGIRLFTRNLNELNVEVFPELIDSLYKLPKGIYDGELVGIKDGINGYNAVKKRVRNELIEELVEQFPLQIKYFDLLNFKGKDLINEPLQSRRKVLDDYVSNTSELTVIDNAKDLKKRYEFVTDNGLEGLVCKDPESHYIIDGRNNDWVKLKKFLNLDLVVLGIYNGEGKAGKLPFAALLLGAYNDVDGRYETITKVGISSRDKIDEVNSVIAGYLSDKASDNVLVSDRINMNTYKRKQPFKWVNPENSVVIETEALNVTRSNNWHSCGLYGDLAYSLRIPKVVKIRKDKASKDITTTEQISDLYCE